MAAASLCQLRVVLCAAPALEHVTGLSTDVQGLICRHILFLTLVMSFTSFSSAVVHDFNLHLISKQHLFIFFNVLRCLLKASYFQQ